MRWTWVEGPFPMPKHDGKWNDHRLAFDGILWTLRTGALRRDPVEYEGKGRLYHSPKKKRA